MSLDLAKLEDVAGTVLSSGLNSTKIRVETTLLPDIFINPGEVAMGPPGLGAALSKFLRPKITVSVGGTQLAQVMPAGDPRDAPPWGLILGIAGVSLGLFVVGFALLKKG